MLKIRSGKLILLGLSEENVRRLKEDQPIKFDASELGLPDIEIGIFYGTTEEEMVNRLLDLKKKQ